MSDSCSFLLGFPIDWIDSVESPRDTIAESDTVFPTSTSNVQPPSYSLLVDVGKTVSDSAIVSGGDSTESIQSMGNPSKNEQESDISTLSKFRRDKSRLLWPKEFKVNMEG